MPSSLSRRTVLLGGVAVASGAAAGCSPGPGSSSEAPTPAGVSSTPPDPAGRPEAATGQAADAALLAAVLADQERLLARARQAARLYPALGASLEPVISIGAAQVRALARAGHSSGAGGRARRPPVPSSPARAMADLQADFEVASQDRTDDCVAAASGPFARVLASLAASLAQQSYTLRTAR